MADVELTPEETGMLRGTAGPGPQWAMEVQLQTAEYFGAREMIPVSRAHIVVDVEIMGKARYDLVASFAESGARFRVPTTTNVQFCDALHAPVLGQDPEMVQQQEQVDNVLREMGAIVVNTCIPYQSIYQPHLGEHVAWGDTGAVCYVNSVFGARFNFEAGSASLAAAFTGRVPNYGLHLSAARRGTLLVDVKFQPSDLADWGALGAAVGRAAGNYWEVPILSGILRGPTSDELKHFLAAVASYGSIPFFGIEGSTPEAHSLEAAFQDRHAERQIELGPEQIASVYSSYPNDGASVDVVVFSGPQPSLYELEQLARALEGSNHSGPDRLGVTSGPRCTLRTTPV